MYKTFLIVILIAILPSCRSRQQEEQLRQRTAMLNQKEQELLVKEKTLAMKEEELKLMAHKLDSTKALDTLMIYDSLITGLWNVTMNCTETDCPGSAVGDTKTEQWNLFYQNSNVICKAMNRNKISRIYSGYYNGNTIELTDAANTTDTSTKTTKIVVWLRKIDDDQMEGQREIIRDGTCRVVYALQLTRQ